MSDSLPGLKPVDRFSEGTVEFYVCVSWFNTVSRANKKFIRIQVQTTIYTYKAVW